MTEPTFQTQPPTIAAAELALTSTLADSRDLPLDVALDIAGALAELLDVFPPYPLPPADLQPVSLRQGLTVALDALDQHSRTARGPQDSSRATSVSRQLRHVLAQLDETAHPDSGHPGTGR